MRCRSYQFERGLRADLAECCLPLHSELLMVPFNGDNGGLVYKFVNQSTSPSSPLANACHYQMGKVGSVVAAFVPLSLVSLFYLKQKKNMAFVADISCFERPSKNQSSWLLRGVRISFLFTSPFYSHLPSIHISSLFNPSLSLRIGRASRGDSKQRRFEAAESGKLISRTFSTCHRGSSFQTATLAGYIKASFARLFFFFFFSSSSSKTHSSSAASLNQFLSFEHCLYIFTHSVSSPYHYEARLSSTPACLHHAVQNCAGRCSGWQRLCSAKLHSCSPAQSQGHCTTIRAFRLHRHPPRHIRYRCLQCQRLCAHGPNYAAHRFAQVTFPLSFTAHVSFSLTSLVAVHQ